MRYEVIIDEWVFDCLRGIKQYLDEHSTKAFDNLASDFESKSRFLEDHPEIFQIYEPNPKYRKIPLEYDYVAFYSIDENAKTATIKTIVHGARDIERYLEASN